MDIKIEGFAFGKDKYYKPILNLRSSIFVEEMGFDKHFEFDGKDEKSMHYIVFCDMFPVGCARWNEDIEHKSITIDRFGISLKYRKQGFATLLLKFILKELAPSKKIVKLISSENSIEFFEQSHFKKLSETTLGNKTVQIMQYDINNTPLN